MQKIEIDLGNNQMDFQIGNFLNAIHQVVAYFSTSGDIVVMSDEALQDALELYVRRLKSGEL